MPVIARASPRMIRLTTWRVFMSGIRLRATGYGGSRNRESEPGFREAGFGLCYGTGVSGVPCEHGDGVADGEIGHRRARFDRRAAQMR